MELVVYNTKGEKTEKVISLSENVFEVTPNDHAIYLDAKQYLANQRQGTHSSLEKSMVNGSTKKLKKQKGTGGARAGSRKSPLFRGGARAFGPHPRDYSFKLNKKLKKLARLSAISYKVKEDNIIVIEDFNFDAPKTKAFVSILSAFKFENSKTLMVLPENMQNIVLSSRNLQKVKVMRACDLNTYDILNAKKMILLLSSIAEIEKSFEN